MLIRKMKPEDAEQVAIIHTLSWQHAYKGIIDQAFLDSIDVKKRELNWRKGVEANDPPLFRFVAEEDGQVVAFACGLENRTKSQLPESDSELWAIYAHPARFNGGLGKALLNHFASELKQNGKKRFCVWVLKDNQLARSFYAKRGGILNEASKEVKIGEQSLVEVAYEFEV